MYLYFILDFFRIKFILPDIWHQRMSSVKYWEVSFLTINSRGWAEEMLKCWRDVYTLTSVAGVNPKCNESFLNFALGSGRRQIYTLCAESAGVCVCVCKSDLSVSLFHLVSGLSGSLGTERAECFFAYVAPHLSYLWPLTQSLTLMTTYNSYTGFVVWA